MEDFSHLSVFSEKKFGEIMEQKIEVARVGEVQLSKEEEKLLRRNPKFAIAQNLQENTIKEEMEKAYSIVRMELRDEDEEEERKEEDNAENMATTEELERKESAEKEEAARARQVYDPLERVMMKEGEE